MSCVPVFQGLDVGRFGEIWLAPFHDAIIDP